MKNKKVLIYQLILLISMLIIWELLTYYNILNPFIYSSPLRIIKTIIYLKNIYIHVYTTLIEIIVSFILGIIISFILSIILYEFKLLYKIIDPFLTMINSLPKIALGPLIIIIFGSNIKSIIIMSLLINIITTTICIYNGFINTDEYRLKLFKSLNANRIQTLFYLVLPSSYKTIISSFKICISQTLVGVIMGEFLVSKQGVGYLIIYGTQIFNMNLVMSGILMLIVMSVAIYLVVSYLEKKHQK